MKKSLWILALGLAIAGICATVEQYAPTPGVEFAAVGSGALKRTEVFSGVENGTAKLERLLSVDCYTDVAHIVTNATGTLTIGVYSNLTTHLVYTNYVDTMHNVYARYPYAQPTDTNLSTTVTYLYDISTNMVREVTSRVTQKETIFNDSLTGNSLTNAIENVYIMSGDRLIFSGTSATNGWLRLIFE